MIEKEWATGVSHHATSLQLDKIGHSREQKHLPIKVEEDQARDEQNRSTTIFMPLLKLTLNETWKFTNDG